MPGEDQHRGKAVSVATTQQTLRGDQLCEENLSNTLEKEYDALLPISSDLRAKMKMERLERETRGDIDLYDMYNESDGSTPFGRYKQFVEQSSEELKMEKQKNKQFLAELKIGASSIEHFNTDLGKTTNAGRVMVDKATTTESIGEPAGIQVGSITRVMDTKRRNDDLRRDNAELKKAFEERKVQIEQLQKEIDALKRTVN